MTVMSFSSIPAFPKRCFLMSNAFPLSLVIRAKIARFANIFYKIAIFCSVERRKPIRLLQEILLSVSSFPTPSPYARTSPYKISTYRVLLLVNRFMPYSTSMTRNIR